MLRKRIPVSNIFKKNISAILIFYDSESNASLILRVAIAYFFLTLRYNNYRPARVASAFVLNKLITVK